jgi:uncharacterized protein
MDTEGRFVTDSVMLWRRLDEPGHESARLLFYESCWHLAGTAVFAHNQLSCRLDYLVMCNLEWQTLSAKVAGWLGSSIVAIELQVDSAQHWQINGVACPAVTGCVDVDLGFSPSTNLLAIRRLDLGIGQQAKARAAWLSFPEFTLEPLEQLYRRNQATNYYYESADGAFTTELEVNSVGFITRYPGLWQVETVND